MKFLARFFLCLLLSISATRYTHGFSKYENSPSISVDAKLRNGVFFLRFKNISESSLTLGPIYFSDSKESGFWVFIYDVKAKRIEQGYALSNPIFGEKRESKYDREILPSQEINFALKKKEVLEYFSEIPQCYYVVFLYRKRNGRSLVFSHPSTPILQCTKS